VQSKAADADLQKCFLKLKPLSLGPLKKSPGDKHSFRRRKDCKSTSIKGLWNM